MFKIGIIAELFGCQLNDAIHLCRKAGADGVAFYAPRPGLSLDGGILQRRHIRKLCTDEGVEITSVIGEIGGHGFRNAAENESQTALLMQVIDLAADLQAPIVTTHIGVIPSDYTCERYDTMLAACETVAKHAESRGVKIGIETGPEPVTVLKGFLDRLSQPGIGVNLDPANLVMVVRDDPVQAVHTLAPYLVSTHAKDGVNHQPCDPEVVYDAFARGGADELFAMMGTPFSETSLGAGDVPWERYLAALDEIGYTGYLTIEHESFEHLGSEAVKSVNFLKKLQIKTECTHA